MPYRSSGTSGNHAPTVGAHSVAAATRIDADPKASLASGPSTRLRLLQSVQQLIPTLSNRFAADIGVLIDGLDTGTAASTALHGALTFQLQRCRHTLTDIQQLLAGMSAVDAVRAHPADSDASHSIAPKDQRALKDACDAAFGQVVALCHLADAHAAAGGRDTDASGAYSTTVAVMASLMLALRTAGGEEPDPPGLPGLAMAAVALRISMAELGVATMLCEDGAGGMEPYAGYDEHRHQLQGMLRSARQRLWEQELGPERDADTMDRVSGVASVVRRNIDALSPEQRQFAFDAIPGVDGDLGPAVHALFLNQAAPEPASTPRASVKAGSAP